MDLSVIKDALSDFATFAANFKGLFQGLPVFIETLAGWFQPTETPGAPEGTLVIGEATEKTSSIFEGLSSKPEETPAQ